MKAPFEQAGFAVPRLLLLGCRAHTGCRKTLLTGLLFTIVTGTTALLAPRASGQLFTCASHQWRTQIDRATLERLKREVLLDEPRQAQAERLYEAHLDRFEAFVEQEQERVQELDDERRKFPPGDIEGNILFNKQRIIIADAMIAGTELDRQLFREWKNLMLEAELEQSWPRFERGWRREAWLRAKSHFTDERIDLVQVVESLDLDWDEFLHEDGFNMLEVALDEYAERLDRDLQRLNAVLIERTRQQAREVLEAHTLLRDQDALSKYAMAQDDPTAAWHDSELQKRLRELIGRQREINEVRHQRRQTELRARERIRGTNRFYRRWVLGLMPAEHAEAFQEQWLRQAMPSLWRGYLEATERYAEEVLASDDLADDVRERIGQFKVEYRSRAVRLAESIVRHIDEWTKVCMTTSITADHNPGLEYEREHLDPLYFRRHNLENEMVDRIAQLLSDDQRKQYPPPKPFDYQTHLDRVR